MESNYSAGENIIQKAETNPNTTHIQMDTELGIPLITLNGYHGKVG
jgi:hypothetical protein